METIAIIGGILGILTGILTMLTALWRISQAAADLRNRHDVLADRIQDGDRHLAHEIDKLVLTLNGVRERMEHINTRISNQNMELRRSLEDVENYLQKSTAFEKRHHG